MTCNFESKKYQLVDGVPKHLKLKKVKGGLKVNKSKHIFFSGVEYIDQSSFSVIEVDYFPKLFLFDTEKSIFQI